MLHRLAILTLAICCLWSAVVAQAEPFRSSVYPEPSFIRTNTGNHTEISLHLSQGAPFRVFTLTAPARLVLDFRGVDWTGVAVSDLVAADADIDTLQFGVIEPGWSRLVATLPRPMLPEDIDMRIDDETGEAVLSLSLVEAAADVFAAKAGTPANALWPDPGQSASLPPIWDDRFVVVIDPGHGGIDPGAERGGVSEKVLMLDFAQSLRGILMRDPEVDVVLTRNADVFVSLQARVAMAHRSRGDLFVSLHADALSEGGAQGATVYLLSDEASDTATAYLAARHNRADVLAGLDLTGSDDEITGVLLDLARQETEPRSEALAQSLIDQMAAAGGPMNSRPLRRAGFSVLKSADIPSVLVEIGFLSSARDLDNLRDPAWRARMADAIAEGILNWRAADAEIRALSRQ